MNGQKIIATGKSRRVNLDIFMQIQRCQPIAAEGVAPYITHIVPQIDGGSLGAGKYEGCRVSIGNPPKKKMAHYFDYSQMLFLTEDTEKARFTFGTDVIDMEFIEVIQFPATGKDGYRCKFTFGDGETCEADMFPSQIIIINAIFGCIMRKETAEFFHKKKEEKVYSR